MRPLLLHDVHASLGARFGARRDAEVVSAYGPVVAEHAAAIGAVGLVDRSSRAVLAVRGPEARSWLHGMTTNDVKGIAPGAGNLQTVVTAKGKMLGDARLLCLGEQEVRLDVPPEAHEAVAAHLDRFLISEDCTLEDVTGAVAILGLVGPRARDALAAAAPGVPELPLHGHVERDVAGVRCRIVAAAPEGVPGFDVLVPAAGARPAFEALLAAVRASGGLPVGEEALEAVRVLRFVPRFGADMGEDTIPLEANLDRAISYTKGCYVGQEVIARATYRGAVTRRLVRLKVPAQARPGARLVAGDRPIGVLTSVVPEPELGGPAALGYLRRDHIVAGAKVPLEGGGEAEVVEVPPPREEP